MESPRHVPCNSDDVKAAEVTAQSAAAAGSNVRNSAMEHKGDSDIGTFPIACNLEKHAQGFYILSGVCHVCGRTFRATGGIYDGKTQPWKNHSGVQHTISKHARTHGAIGYTPRRNLDTMRLDWVRSPSEYSEAMADTSASINREITSFCTGCAKWRRMAQFRSGTSTCNTCLRIACAGCGNKKKQTQYRTQDVYNFLNKKINALCRTCRLKGTKLGRRRHRTHKGEHCRERRCTQCGVYRASSHFRRTKGGRVDICRTCELVPCAACAAMLPRRNFTDADIYRYFYFAGTKHITCLVCKEQQHARQERLQNLMEKSDRAACWCKHPHAHTRKCPLHARYEGERPYPGCDVMSRADSDWFIEQRKKNRYGRGT